MKTSQVTTASSCQKSCQNIDLKTGQLCDQLVKGHGLQDKCEKCSKIARKKLRKERSPGYARRSRQRHPGRESLQRKAYKVADRVMDFLLDGVWTGKMEEVRTNFLTFFEFHRRELLQFFWEALHEHMNRPFICSPNTGMALRYIQEVNSDIRHVVGLFFEPNRRTQFKYRFGILNRTNVCGTRRITLSFPPSSFSLTDVPTLQIFFETELFCGCVFVRKIC